jgi:dihydroorotase
MRSAAFILLALSLARSGSAQTNYDLLLKGGHVIDARNGIDAVRNVAIEDRKIAAVATNIPASQATKTVGDCLPRLSPRERGFSTGCSRENWR